MRLAIKALASGSSGNCYIVASETTTLLVDAGISGRQIEKGLESFGREKADALLLTHEHSDHIMGLPIMLKKGINLFANEKTISAIQEKCFEKKSDQTIINVFETGSVFSIGDINVSSFSLSHDAADPTGYSFEKDGAVITILTDTGYITEGAFRYMEKADILVLESNYDESMLRVGKYPWFLKQRILGKKGHLSNDAAAEGLVNVLKMREMAGRDNQKTVLLAHLSKENNFKEMALATVKCELEKAGFVNQDKLTLFALERQEESESYTIE